VEQRRRKNRFLPVIVGGLAVATLAGVAVALMRSFLASTPLPPKPLVQEIHLIRPPPPPPDLPPPPPPPPEEKVVVPDQQRPDPTPSNEPPPGDQLGLDAQGTAGGDAFGLAGRPGGRDLLASGGNVYVWYAGLLKDAILDRLSADQRAHRGSYTLIVHVWVRSDGTVDHVRLAQSSGDRDRDQAIEADLSDIGRLSQAPPTDMPNPISMRIVSRG